jgi:hypothetical protein
MTTTREILKEAAQEIRLRGLHKGGVGFSLEGSCGVKGPCCAWAAIGVVADRHGLKDPSDRFPPFDALVRHLGATPSGNLHEDAEFVFAWNDAPERTQDEVVAALEKAAEACS